MSLQAGQRFKKQRPCPVCGGADNDPRGKERRCHGYMSTDGLYVHCSREEKAAGLPLEQQSLTYAHKLHGPCACGTTHREDPDAPRFANGTMNGHGPEIEAQYDYRDEHGTLVYQVVRMAGKRFLQRRPVDGKWEWKVPSEVRRVLYRLPELLASPQQAVMVVEGEKDADALRAIGCVATTNPGGAGKWALVSECAKKVLAGRHVVIIPDDDEPGHRHAQQVSDDLVSIAASVRVLELPGHGKDAHDWLRGGGTIAALDELIAATPERPTPSIGRTWEHCIDEIYQRMHEPWVNVEIAGTVVAVCRNGSFIPLVAPSGAGKSSLVIQMLIDHALNRGCAVYVTHELDGDEAAGRGVGQLCSFSWAAVLRGEVPRASIPNIDRLRILERDEATLDNMSRAITELKRRYPGQPIIAIVDYIQATPAPPGKERGFTANISAELRRAAKKERVVVIGVSQTSTANSTKMRGGELLGIDGSSTGAETSQIERDGYVIMTLGDRQLVDNDTISWKLSVAKNRMGESDVVYELHFRGRVGTWSVVGDPKRAADVRDSRDLEKKAKKLAELKRSIVAFVEASSKPVSTIEIIKVHSGKESVKREAIKELLTEKALVHVPGVRRGGAMLIWTPAKAAQTEIQS